MVTEDSKQQVMVVKHGLGGCLTCLVLLVIALVALPIIGLILKLGFVLMLFNSVKSMVTGADTPREGTPFLQPGPGEEYAGWNCPVCGYPPRETPPLHRRRYGGKVWFLSSSRCEAKFDSNPEYYTRRWAEQGPPKITCPVCEGSIKDKGLPVRPYGGYLYSVCSPKCQSLFNADPKRYAQ